MSGEIGDTFVHIDEFDELGVEVGVAEGTVGHEGIIEVLWIVGVVF